MSAIAYYISSHGYGHAARQQAVIKELVAAGAAVHVRTAAPQKFFPGVRSYQPQRYDIGLIQADALSFDVGASLRWYAEFLEEQAALIPQEVAFLRRENVQLVVSDMPPIALDIAEAAGLPGVVVTHFTWDWVYEHYLDDYPNYDFVVERIRGSYRKASLALQMQIPLPHDFTVFSQVEPLPLVYNAPTQSRQQVRTAFGVPDGAKLGLLSMGGHAWGSTDIRALREMEGWVFLVMPGAWEQVREQPERFRVVPPSYPDYHNLIAHADVVVGKAGGSTVAEVVGHGTRMIYTTHPQWRESALLSETLRRYASASLPVALDAFQAGAWLTELERILTLPAQQPAFPRNGAQVAAQRLLALL